MSGGRKLHPEVLAMNRLAALLRGLSPDAQVRVAQWAVGVAGSAALASMRPTLPLGAEAEATHAAQHPLFDADPGDEQ